MIPQESYIKHVKRWTEGTSAFGRCSAFMLSKNGMKQMLCNCSCLSDQTPAMRENHSFLHMALFCLFVGFLNQNSTNAELDVKNAEDLQMVGQCKKEPAM